ncbi:MAG: hypothetical protein QW087_03875 [Methanomassiliicoccales archaeon]
MSEFSFKHGVLWKGALSAIISALNFLIVPIIIISVISKFGEEILGDYFAVTRSAILTIGIPIIIMSFLKGFYPKGSISRLIFGMMTAALVCAWIWFVLQGGIINIHAEEVEITFDFSMFVVVLIVIAALGGALYVAEFVSFRKEFLDHVQRKEEMKSEEKSKSSELNETKHVCDEVEETSTNERPSESSETTNK